MGAMTAWAAMFRAALMSRFIDNPHDGQVKGVEEHRNEKWR
jgi:hypothetical protein